jgi:hypothetical protein
MQMGCIFAHLYSHVWLFLSADLADLQGPVQDSWLQTCRGGSYAEAMVSTDFCIPAFMSHCYSLTA